MPMLSAMATDGADVPVALALLALVVVVTVVMTVRVAFRPDLHPDVIPPEHRADQPRPRSTSRPTTDRQHAA